MGLYHDRLRDGANSQSYFEFGDIAGIDRDGLHGVGGETRHVDDDMIGTRGKIAQEAEAFVIGRTSGFEAVLIVDGGDLGVGHDRAAHV